MSLIDRFLTAFRGEDRGDAEPPGLFLDADAVTWVIGPDGTRTRVADGGSSSVLMHAVNITSAQIKNWASVPVELIPAPGAGLAVMVFHMYVALTGVGTPYTDPDGSGTRYAGSATSAAAWQNVDITLGTDTVWWISGGVTDALPSVSTDAAVEVFGAGAEPSGGDGVLRVVSYYAEVPLT